MPEQRGERGGAIALRALLERAQPRPGASVAEHETPPDGACPECGGRGWVLHPDGGAGTAVRCGCTVRDLLPRLLAEAGIPSRYQGCRIENFQLTGSRSQQLRRARETTARWLEEFLASGRPSESGLLFIGPPGVGKTHLAAAALAELIRRYRVHGRFVDFTSLLYQIQSTFDAGSPETKQSVLDPVLDAEVLVIDELGAQKPTPWVSEVLYLILNGRYTRRLTTIFTTNYYLEAEGGARPSGLDRGADVAAPDLLASRIPAMLVSRLWEMARPVVIDSDDHRQVVKRHQHQ
jgi:DNA replication protein DnaC